jgi:hypothetical protein
MARNEYEYQMQEEHEERESRALRAREREEETSPMFDDGTVFIDNYDSELIGDAISGWLFSQRMGRRAA